MFLAAAPRQGNSCPVSAASDAENALGRTACAGRDDLSHLRFPVFGFALRPHSNRPGPAIVQDPPRPAAERTTMRKAPSPWPSCATNTSKRARPASKSTPFLCCKDCNHTKDTRSPETEASLTAKLKRGIFAALYFLVCLAALELSGINLEDVRT